MKKIRKMFFLGSIIICPLFAFSDDVSQGQEEKSYVLKKSVVSASGFAQDIKDAPASIASISEKDLQEVDYHDLAEAIYNVPGVDIGTG